ncbi:hypothetical protein COO91_04777 [Nostoc flagelliforme CCNUN1]|uniref:Uncharacterized protein n=1 Tax=Nostoc flagelliforme CCNUN1 TaxID=2038116 RepID=A0A2K8STL6_9NOSO|nr:hypothetical protein [Nostoc flagelliforme]AUB38802.1 hypothetical protein COO91_04777 [Nostoc flagelliforme CCNUN1]
MRKTTIFTLTLLSLAILPAMADQTLVGQIWSDFQLYSRELQNYFQDYGNLNENLNSVETQSQSAIDGSKGELNIPNPVAAGRTVRDNVINNSYRSDSRASRFENNAAVRGNLASNELYRLITRGVAVGILGKDAQDRTKGKLLGIQDEIIDSDNPGQPSTDIPSTIGTFNELCKVLKGSLDQLLNLNTQTIQIQNSQRKIVAETFAQTIQTNQSLQYSNLNLANISQQAEEANRARRVDTSTEAARLLRATSQLDLFGREALDKCGMNLQLKPSEMQIRDKLCQVIR